MRQIQAAFYEASAYFSEEEWKLLHDWQKGLYRNVMKEIHQALTSLGPLIATTVFTLLSKEKEDLISMGNQDSERRGSTNVCRSNGIANPEDLFRINGEENEYLKTPPDTDLSDENICLDTGISILSTDICLKKEEPLSFLMDRLSEEVGESSAHHKLGDEVISFRIKEEDDSFSMDCRATNRRGPCSPKDGRSPSRQWKVDRAIQSAENMPTDSTAVGAVQGNVLHGFEMETNSRSRLWAENSQEDRGEETISCEQGFINKMHSDLHDGNQEAEGQNTDSCRVNASEATLNMYSQITPQNWREFISTESEQNPVYNDGFLNNQKPSSVDRPYQCTECYKSFTRKQHFIVHLRTHTGERPYQCTECGKSFSQVHNLARHQKVHVGEKPHQCSQCGKSFSRKYNLIGHQRLHVRPVLRGLLESKEPGQL